MEVEGKVSAIRNLVVIMSRKRGVTLINADHKTEIC